MPKSRRRTTPPEPQRASRFGPNTSAPPPRHSTHRPKKATSPDVVIADVEDDEPVRADEGPSRLPSTRPPPPPRNSTRRPKKQKRPDVLIEELVEGVEDAEDAEGGPSRSPTTRPPPAAVLRHSLTRAKGAPISETSIAELIAELMIDLSPYGPAKEATRPPARAATAAPRGKKEKLPKAVIDEVVADRKKDPRSD